MGNCCTVKAGGVESGRTAQQIQNAYGRPKHRKRLVVTSQDPIVYQQNLEMAKLSVKDEAAFIKLAKQNQVYDFSRYTGFNYAAESFIILESGRRVMDTSNWNPLTFALVLNRPVLLNFLLQQAIRFDELLGLGLKNRDASNCIRYSKSELIDCQIETLILMLENKSEHVSTIFN